ncbi:4-hydroxy-tetrahydrodipicolinate reductase, partial [candidate division KSB1 bacterium]
VIGTTGWYDDLEKAKELVQQYQGGVIYAPNFSVGVNLFFEIVQRAAEAFRNFSQYDVYLL